MSVWRPHSPESRIWGQQVESWCGSIIRIYICGHEAKEAGLCQGRSWNKMESCLTKALADPTGSTGTKALWSSQVLGVRVGRLDPTLTSHGVHADPRKSMAWVNWLLSADNVPFRSGELWASSSPSRVWRGIRVACYWPTASKSAFLASCLKPASAR